VPGTCVIGLQWGDEAKGKLVDLLTERHDIVVRYQGGSNAGHTVVAEGRTYKLSLIPSGILYPRVTCVIASGVVLNPKTVLAEIDGLRGQGFDVEKRLLISDRAHVIFPWHIAEDRLLDQLDAAGDSIGTTQRGIGPCYRDKVGRSHAVRLGDLYEADFPSRVEFICREKERLLGSYPAGADSRALDPAAILREYAEYAQRLRPYAADTTSFLLEAMEREKRVLFEGAQGSLLDIDHGTFPYVTSSNSSGVGVSSGAGVPGKWMREVIGVLKAYSTRVGGGPFPTELESETGEHLRTRGKEYGTVTGRPRRCGWFDAVAARYTVRLGGVDKLAVMLLDVLGGLPEIKICTAYEIDGEETRCFPSHVHKLRRARPVLESLEGWSEDISGVRRWSDLPPRAIRYVERISELLNCPVEVVSVGPDRAQTIFVDGA
jgi:adenylosuccinate synthase